MNGIWTNVASYAKKILFKFDYLEKYELPTFSLIILLPKQGK